MGGKSADAFRTISEVSDLIGTPAHVLRFWETKFGQIRPVKRAGGRRYYRPADVALIDGIRRLLHDDGMTIRGVQKILREKGQRHVMGLSRFAEGLAGAAQHPPAGAQADATAPATAVDAPDDGPAQDAASGAAPGTSEDAAAMPEPKPDPEPEAPELPFGDPPRTVASATAAADPAEGDAAGSDDAPKAPATAEPPAPASDRPVSALLRGFRPDAAQRARLAELEPRLAALGARLAAPPPGSAR